LGFKKGKALRVVQLLRLDEYFFKECDEDEGVFIAQHIWTGKGFFGTGSFGKIVANVPTALQALRFKLGILALVRC
jgi:hypothetical protein